MKEKETYEAPQVEILKVKSEGIICASSNNPFDGLNEYNY